MIKGWDVFGNNRNVFALEAGLGHIDSIRICVIIDCIYVHVYDRIIDI